LTDFDLIAHVRALAPADGAPAPGDHVVVAVSGGADSVALFDVLHTLAPERRWLLTIAHLDHGLRSDSERDAAFCRALGAERGIDVVTERTDVAALAAETGAGIEAAGRRARHDFLERVRTDRGAQRIATAHHLDDHAESVLLALGRGTGLRGLRGVAPVDGRRIRPLRGVRREALRAHLRARGIAWREDPTNADTEFTRNRLRHNVLPELIAAFDPGVVERIGRLGAHAAADVALLDALVEEKLESLRRPGPDGTLVLDRAGFLGTAPDLRSALIRAAARRLFPTGSHQKWNADRVSDVLRFIERAHAGQRWSLPGAGRLAVERDRLILMKVSDEWTVTGPGTLGSDRAELRTELLPTRGRGCSFSGPPMTTFVDAARVRPPFVLRTIRPGDRLQPRGRAGHRKVTTLLSERGIPREDRSRQLVVCDREQVVWAVGLDTCDAADIGTTTRWVWHLRVEGADDVPSAACGT
jgi:tRNA(Ile)-lysidine synthase